VQAAQLQHDEEQEEDDGAARIEQVLPFLPETHGTQRVQVMRMSECGLRIGLRVSDVEFNPQLAIRNPQSTIRNGEGQ
jgi:hypothetical protein